MKSIIHLKDLQKHTIEPYRFKVLGGLRVVESSNKKDDEESIKEETLIEEKSSESPSEIKQQNEFVEQLLKKSDELSSNIVKLQMQIEKQEAEFERRLASEVEKERKIAFEDGYKKAKDELEKSIEEIKTRYLNSIKKLDDEAKKYGESLKRIESELGSTAIEIAKEVVAKEIETSSSKVAIALSKELLKELKDAKEIRLKVNPKDYEALKEELSQMKNLFIDSDSAISEGGVVILSEIGNLDGNISTRFEKVKNLISG